MKLTVNGQQLEAQVGELLSDVLLKNGFPHPRPCGGKGTCGKCTVKVNGQSVRACQYTVTEDITVELAVEGTIFSENRIAPEEDISSGTQLALDIGTTTLALAVLAPAEKKVLRVVTFNNPQRAFGADVISRIEYAQQQGVAAMTAVLRETLSEQITALLQNQSSFDILHVAGNTTMLHLFLGESPVSMGVAPYTPVFLDEKWLDAAVYGIQGVKRLHVLPSFSAFVGADLVAGVNYIGLPEQKYRLLLDLGTNAEVLLFSKDRLLATAAAAGPCFEGATISCGMSATRGAICAVDESGLTTIENAPPAGICGTGLIDSIAFLLRKEELDDTGYLEHDFVLCEGVRLTQADVRQYQLAKSAVYSAILTLMERQNVNFDDIEHLYVSGGFSAKLNIASAVLTGLLPRELSDRIVSVGNSSLLGTIKAAMEQSDLSPLLQKAAYVDLSADSGFYDRFIANMGF